MTQILERLLSKAIIMENGCWKWNAAHNAYGYGVIRVNGQTLHAHRLMYELCYEDIPKNYSVCHTCDNRWCINPSHLFCATHKQNMEDMALKGRCGRAKITREIAIKIAADIKSGKFSLREIGEKYSLSKSAICAIKAGRSWDNVLRESKMEILLEEISEAGYLLNNLFQHDNGSWQANLRSASGHTAFAYGTTAYEALALTLNLLEEVEPFAEDQPSKVWKGPNIETKANLRSVMANLLPKKQMNRRL